MPDLPIGLDVEYPDSPLRPSVKRHQQHHDVVHAVVNRVPDDGSLVATESTASATIATAVEPVAADASRALLLARTVTYTDLARTTGDQIGFIKGTTNPLLTTANTGAGFPTILWPWVIRVDTILTTPLGAYYMWFSTDHEGPAGQVGLAYANDLAGPWTVHGPVWKDTTSGSETETPSVIYDALAGEFVMYYQQIGAAGAIGSQVTCYATSPDGVTWTRGGIALDVPDANSWPVPGHTGYFRPFRVGSGWVGFSLLRGTVQAAFGLSYSDDGRTWRLDPRPLGWGQEYLPGDRRIDWNTTNIILWRGRYLWIGLTSSFAAAAATRDTRWEIAPLSDDFRSFSAPPQQLFAATQPWESSFMMQGHAFIDQGELNLIYRSGDGDALKPFAFGRAVVEAL